MSLLNEHLLNEKNGGIDFFFYHGIPCRKFLCILHCDNKLSIKKYYDTLLYFHSLIKIFQITEAFLSMVYSTTIYVLQLLI